MYQNKTKKVCRGFGDTLKKKLKARRGGKERERERESSGRCGIDCSDESN